MSKYSRPLCVARPLCVLCGALIVTGLLGQLASSAAAQQSEAPASPPSESTSPPSAGPQSPGMRRSGPHPGGRGPAGRGPGQRFRERERALGTDKADKPEREPRPDVPDLRRRAQEMMREGRERMLNMSPEERAAFRQKQKDTRGERRAASIERLKKRWGAALLKPEAQKELKLHAERMARLRRIQALAEDNKKPELLDRVMDLMRREQKRHMLAMSGFSARAKGVPGPDGLGPRSLPSPDRPRPGPQGAPQPAEKAP